MLDCLGDAFVVICRYVSLALSERARATPRRGARLERAKAAARRSLRVVLHGAQRSTIERRMRKLSAACRHVAVLRITAAVRQSYDSHSFSRAREAIIIISGEASVAAIGVGTAEN